MKLLLMLFVLLSLCLQAAEKRDPFWPLGFEPGADDVPASPASAPPGPAPARTLSQAEMERLAREEAEKIQNSVRRRGTMIMGGKIYAYAGERWVTLGDTITVSIGNQEYRLLVTRLTRNDIELEPHRISPNNNPGTRP